MFDIKFGSCLAEVRRRVFIALMASICGLLFIASPSMADERDDLLKAATLDNKHEVQSLLKRGVSPNLTEPARGESALMLAAREGSNQALAVLLNARGVNINLRAKNGDSALMIAAYKKNKIAVEMLLAKGAKVNNDGWTALHYAAAAGDTEIIQLLLKKSAEVDAPSPNLTTPLMMAAGSGNIYAVKAILDAGADLNLVNEQGLSAIDFAQRAGQAEIVEGLKYRQKLAERRANEAAAVEDKREQPILIDTRLPPMD